MKKRKRRQCAQPAGRKGKIRKQEIIQAQLRGDVIRDGEGYALKRH